MTQAVLPRYFVASAQLEAAPVAAGADARIEHCVDALLWHRASTGQTEELVVGVDRAGVLQCAPRSRAVLSANAQRELHAHELLSANARRATARMLEAERLFLFDMELVEQAGSGGELNQPLFVYGSLLGPLAKQTAPARSKGQLALTRADLLEGLLLGQDWPFCYTDEPGRERRHHHALLPAGRAEDLSAGSDLVIGYPRAPFDLSAGDPENAAVVQLLIGELVAALRADLEREERAQGTLSRLFSAQRSLGLRAPESHDIDDWLRLAASALSCLPKWPSPTAEALRKATAQASARGGPITPERSGTPGAAASQPLAVAVSSIPKRPTLLRQESAAPPDWSGDFLPEQHRVEKDSTDLSWKAPSPRAATARPTPSSTQEWMQDFKPEDPSTQTDDPVTQPAREQDKPDWRKDFDDENK